MAGVGLVMAAIFSSIWFGPWKALQQAVAAERLGPRAPRRATRSASGSPPTCRLGAFVVALASLGLAGPSCEAPA